MKSSSGQEEDTFWYWDRWKEIQRGKDRSVSGCEKAKPQEIKSSGSIRSEWSWLRSMKFSHFTTSYIRSLWVTSRWTPSPHSTNYRGLACFFFHFGRNTEGFALQLGRVFVNWPELLCVLGRFHLRRESIQSWAGWIFLRKEVRLILRKMTVEGSIQSSFHPRFAKPGFHHADPEQTQL